MTTHFHPARAPATSAALPRVASAFVGAAALCAAIRAAAALAPEVAPELEFPHRYPGQFYPASITVEYGAGAEIYMPMGKAEGFYVETEGPASAYPRQYQRPEMPGPFLPPRDDVRVSFAYATPDGGRGSLTVANLRGALLALVDKVQANRGAFDGKAKRTRLPRKPRAGAAPHTAARELWAEGDVVGALTLALSVGAVFFGAGKDKPIPYMSAQHVEAAGHDWIIARGLMKNMGAFSILHMHKALSVGETFTTYSAALDYLETQSQCEAWRARLSHAVNSLATFSQTDALAHYMGADADAADETGAPVVADMAADVLAPVTPAPTHSEHVPTTIGEVSERMQLRTPYQYQPQFARIAIERLDADSNLRTSARLNELLDAYARTYGVECSQAERDSAHYTCSRRFPDFPRFPVATDPPATQSRRPRDGDRIRLHELKAGNGKPWHSEAPFDCQRDYHVRELVLAGFLGGAARWATCDATGAFLYGLGADGMELTAPPVVTGPLATQPATRPPLSAYFLAHVNAAPSIDLFDYLADFGREPIDAAEREPDAMRAAVLADVESTGEAVYWDRLPDAMAEAKRILAARPAPLDGLEVSELGPDALALFEPRPAIEPARAAELQARARAAVAGPTPYLRIPGGAAPAFRPGSRRSTCCAPDPLTTQSQENNHGNL